MKKTLVGGTYCDKSGCESVCVYKRTELKNLHFKCLKFGK